MVGPWKIYNWLDEESHTDEIGRTEERPTPMRTPNPRISHQSNAPTMPAAPVPDAK
jgi:hypothetical protein